MGARGPGALHVAPPGGSGVRERCTHHRVTAAPRRAGPAGGSGTIGPAPCVFVTMARMRTTPRALAAVLAGALLVTGCSSSDDGDPTPPSYEKSDSVRAQVLPQLAANGEDVESAADAAWVVDATIADAEEGTAVTLVAKDDDGWSDVDEQETDDKGRVSLTSRDSGDLHVGVGDGDDAIGTKVSTDDAPEATFTDDFDDEDSVDHRDGSWHTRDQGYSGVRTCSKASADAVEVTDGVLRLSVTEDPEREGDECQLPGKRRARGAAAAPLPPARDPDRRRRRRRHGHGRPRTVPGLPGLVRRRFRDTCLGHL